MTPNHEPYAHQVPAAGQAVPHGGNPPADRVVLVGGGDTAFEAILGTGTLHRRLTARHKTFVCFNTQITSRGVDAALLHQGTLLPTPIPFWATEDVSDSLFDDHAAERPFSRNDRPCLASLQGCENRGEGALACIAARDDLYRAIVEAVSRVGARDGGAVVTVHLVVVAFGGRGTGSGGLPVVIGMLEPLRAAFAGQVNLVITIAAQLPTVRVEDLALYRLRSATLLAEVTAMAEEAVPTDPERRTGGWRNGLPWDDFLIFSTGGGRAVRPRGVVTDVTEAARYLAAVLHERLSGESGHELAALAPLRVGNLLDRDRGTELPRMFSATGVAELVYEPDAAIDHAAAYMENALYDAVRSKHDERN